jgi:hypothetical protein
LPSRVSKREGWKGARAVVWEGEGWLVVEHDTQMLPRMEKGERSP